MLRKPRNFQVNLNVSQSMGRRLLEMLPQSMGYLERLSLSALVERILIFVQQEIDEGKISLKDILKAEWVAGEEEDAAPQNTGRDYLNPTGRLGGHPRPGR